MAVKKALKSTAAGNKQAAVKKAPEAPAAKKAAPKKTAAKKAAVRKPAGRKAAAVKKATPAATPARPLDRSDIHRRIRVAAYYKFVKRGYRHGKHVNDWYEAEKEIASRL